jgi:hypothetical protein
LAPRSPVQAIVAVQLAVIVVGAIVTVARMPVFALVDEQAHYSYVQSVADDHRLPVLGRDRTAAVVEAVREHTYPRPPRLDPSRLGLAGYSYEAFQPPLYYVAAAPLAAAVPSYSDRVTALRALDAWLLCCAIWLLWLLAREVAPTNALSVFAFALTGVMWPGVVVRSVTISNAALEMVAAPLVLLLLWRAHARGDRRLLVAAGAVTGAALLTRLTLVCLVPVLVAVAALAVRRYGRRAAPAAAFAVALPALMIAPWLAFNIHHFDALTAERVVRRMQEPVLNPTRRQYGLSDLWHGLRTLLTGVLPEEWWVAYLSSFKRWLSEAFGALFLLAPLVLAWRAPAPGRARLLGFFVAPIALLVAGMAYALATANWASFLLPRYLYPELGAFGLFAAIVWRGALGERGLLWLTAALTVAVGVAWVDVATVHPFTP